MNIIIMYDYTYTFYIAYNFMLQVYIEIYGINRERRFFLYYLFFITVISIHEFHFFLGFWIIIRDGAFSKNFENDILSMSIYLFVLHYNGPSAVNEKRESQCNRVVNIYVTANYCAEINI